MFNKRGLGRIHRKENSFNQDQINLAPLLANQVSLIVQVNYIDLLKSWFHWKKATTLYRLWNNQSWFRQTSTPPPPPPLLLLTHQKSLRICTNLKGGPRRGWGARAPPRPPVATPLRPAMDETWVQCLARYRGASPFKHRKVVTHSLKSILALIPSKCKRVFISTVIWLTLTVPRFLKYEASRCPHYTVQLVEQWGRCTTEKSVTVIVWTSLDKINARTRAWLESNESDRRMDLSWRRW